LIIQQSFIIMKEISHQELPEDVYGAWNPN
jgi:hypothetical protein